MSYQQSVYNSVNLLKVWGETTCGRALSAWLKAFHRQRKKSARKSTLSLWTEQIPHSAFFAFLVLRKREVLITVVTFPLIVVEEAFFQ